jgi:putative metal-binding protein
MNRQKLKISITCILAVTILVSPAALADPPEWNFHGVVAQGGQIDAVRGPGDVLHLIAARYYQFDVAGNELVSEDQGDGQQGSMDFPPAIAVGADNSVHIITRHNGSWTDGHDLRYRRRNTAGTWDRDYLFSSRVKRNYVVAIAKPVGDSVYLCHSQGGDNVWGDLRLFKAGQSSASELGSISNIWRSDIDTRMRAEAANVYMVSGKCDPDGRAFFLHATASDSLPGDLDASQQEHMAGTGRRGFTDLYVDGQADIHFSYGADQKVFYNRYSSQGLKAHANDVQLFDNLGEWHMSIGLSAVAASDDGSSIVAVALKSDGSQQAADSDLLWVYSNDSGQTWSSQADTGKNVNGGEGRCRPRLVAIGQKFFLFFGDNQASGISLASMTVFRDRDQDGHTEDIDCDDNDDQVYPGAVETCNNQVDDNCDGDTDEGCDGEPDGGQPDGGADGGNDGGVDAGADSGADSTQQDGAADDNTDSGADTNSGGDNQEQVSGGCGCGSVASARSGQLSLAIFPVLINWRRRTISRKP